MNPLDQWFYPLTPAQARVSELVAAGLNNKEIARTMNIDQNTVDKHISCVFRNLYLQDRSGIRNWVLTHRPPGDLMRTAVYPYR